MHTKPKRLLTAITAVLTLTLGVGTASAARSFSATNNTLLTYVSPGLTFTGEPEGNRIICAVTLTASLHSSFSKTRGTLIGFVNGGRIDSCRNNFGTTMRAIPLVSHRLPWHITLNSFRGTLPRITEVLITINDFKILLEVREPLFGRIQGCLYRGNISFETRGRTGAAEYTLELLIPQRGANIKTLFEDRLNLSVAPCEISEAFTGTFHANLPPVLRLI